MPRFGFGFGPAVERKPKKAAGGSSIPANALVTDQGEAILTDGSEHILTQ